MKRVTGMKIPKSNTVRYRDQIFDYNPFHGFGLTKIVLRK